MEATKGIGIDLVTISEIKRLCEDTKGVFENRTFSDIERKDADTASNRYEFLAGRFAVKEAVFKAICSYAPGNEFDFRIVEAKRLDNGAPQVVINEKLQAVLDASSLSTVLISISNEGDLAVAIAQVY